jgi:hypothetical protein
MARARDFDNAEMVGLPQDGNADPNEGSDAETANTKPRPDLSHVNKNGSRFLSTILHGADHNPQQAGGDYIGCLRIAMEHGVALPRRAIDASGSQEIRAFLQQWVERMLGQVVEHGIF